MYYELALISVAIGGAYWGWQFVRQESLRLYGALNIVAALLAGLGFLGQRNDDARFGLPGAIGLGAGACLLVVGPFARGLARRAAGAERFRLAQALLGIADVLAPGSGVGDEKALLAAMREIRDGNIQTTVDALTSAKFRASPEARIAIDERIAMLYLAAYRWDEAIAHAEEHLFGAIPPASDAAPGIALRRVLGLAPPVWVELLGAYAYTGNLDQAARMLARLEDVCADRPEAGIWVHRGRLIFLALAGRVGAVQTLVEPKRARHMKAAARTYWVAVAHERHGETAAAEAAYAKARAGSRGRPRVLIDQAIARLPTVKPAELGPTATEVVTRVEAEPVPIVTDTLRPRRPWAVRGLVASMVAVALAISIFLGPSTDVGVLVRDGAMVRSLVRDGEWWRIVSAIFIHVGGLHLLNLIGLWLIGRLAEDLFGSWRTLVIFALAGLAGCIASFFASPAGISAGASGGMFGLLGAVFVETTLHRRRYRGWPRGMWGSLALVTVAQIAVGFLYPFIDQWAHGGGLIVGAVLGALLSPHVRWQRIGLHISRVIAVAFVGVAGFAAVMVVRTPLTTSLARSPLVTRETTTYTAVAPLSWGQVQDELYAPDIYMTLVAQPGQVGTPDTTLKPFTDVERLRAKDKQFDQIEAAPYSIIPLPPDWRGNELVVSVADSLGTRQLYRVVCAGRPDGDNRTMLVSLYVPESIARAAPAFFTNLLASIRAR
jgi:membrane associated rhomboid family serine protease